MSIADDIPWQKINRLYIAFATIRDGELTNIAVNGSTQEAEDRINNIVQLYRAGNAAGEIFITSNYGDKDVDEEYLQAAANPQHFADSVRAYLEQHDLDGYDMDWESHDINDYADALLNACSDTFRQAGPNSRGKSFQITHTIWPGVHTTETVARLNDVVDSINLMTYNSGLDDLETYAVEYNDAGFPYAKMIVGVESEFGMEGNVDADMRASVAAKADFVKKNGLAGIYTWRLDNDTRRIDENTPGGPPSFLVAGWVYDEMSQ